MSKLRGLLDIRAGERLPVALSFTYFFLLLSTYYTLRPIRDALAASALGAPRLRWAYLAVLLVMLAITPLFGALVARFPRRQVLPGVYAFFAANVIALYAIFERVPQDDLALGFFIWLSVFNLFVVSVFWSFMADIWSREQARRLFPLIAAGGSLGAICGPLLARLLVAELGVAQLFLVAAALLLATTACVVALLPAAPRGARAPDAGLGGEAWAGAKLAFTDPFLRTFTAFMVLGSMTGVWLYLEQTELASRLGEGARELTAFFAQMDLAVNLITIALQLFVTAPLLRRIGLGWTLALLPLIAALGFGLLSLAPALGLVAAIVVLRRAVLFAITNPVSQTLFTVVSPEARYKFKNFLDTAVWRAGDSLGAWLFAAVLLAGLLPVNVIGGVLACAWLVVTWRLVRRYRAAVS